VGVAPEIAQDIPRFAEGPFCVDVPRLLATSNERAEAARHLEAVEDSCARAQSPVKFSRRPRRAASRHEVVLAGPDPARTVERESTAGDDGVLRMEPDRVSGCKTIVAPAELGESLSRPRSRQCRGRAKSRSKTSSRRARASAARSGIVKTWKCNVEPLRARRSTSLGEALHSDSACYGTSCTTDADDAIEAHVQVLSAAVRQDAIARNRRLGVDIGERLPWTRTTSAISNRGALGAVSVVHEGTSLGYRARALPLRALFGTFNGGSLSSGLSAARRARC
jgi:hypothetical protein